MSPAFCASSSALTHACAARGSFGKLLGRAQVRLRRVARARPAAAFCSPCLNTACTMSVSSFFCFASPGTPGAVLRRRAQVSMFS